MGGSVAGLLQGLTSRLHCIPEADGDPCVPQPNGEMLLDADRHVNYHSPTVKHIRWARMPFLVMLLLWLPARIHAEDAPLPPSGIRILSSDSPAQSKPTVVSIHSGVRPNAVAVSIHGKCYCSVDGLTFTNLERG